MATKRSTGQVTLLDGPRPGVDVGLSLGQVPAPSGSHSTATMVPAPGGTSLSMTSSTGVPAGTLALVAPLARTVTTGWIPRRLAAGPGRSSRDDCSSQ